MVQTEVKQLDYTTGTIECRNYIGGEWVPSTSGRTFQSINPANTDDVVGNVPLSTAEDVAKAVEAAKKAQREWSLMPAPKRAEIMYKAAQLFLERKEALSRLVTREMGKVFAEGMGDVQETIDELFYMAGEGRRLKGCTTPSELRNKFAMTIRQPVGVVGLITPWNFPTAIPSWKTAPALIAGNTIVFKPASDTPCCANEFVRVFEEAGVPKGVINLVHGSGSEVGNAIVDNPDVKLISFTGSTAVGKKVAEKAAAQNKKYSLEMGGKNVVIVMDDANLDLAVDGILWGAFGTTGQRCTATSRLLVHEKVKEEVLNRLIEKANALKLGYGNESGVDVGPVVNESQLNTVKKYVEIAKNEGGKLVCGGEPAPEAGNGYFYKPTIFDGVTPEMTIFNEEIFGPVLAVTTISSFEEGITLANRNEYGLSTAIYTKNVNQAFEAMRDLESGIMYVNAPTIGAEVHLPFGGWKNTGNGHREGSVDALEIFTELKTIFVDYSDKLQRAQIDVD